MDFNKKKKYISEILRVREIIDQHSSASTMVAYEFLSANRKFSTFPLVALRNELYEALRGLEESCINNEYFTLFRGVFFAFRHIKSIHTSQPQSAQKLQRCFTVSNIFC